MSGSRHLSKTMVELRLKQKALHDKLYTLERQIFALETAYLEDTQFFGNVVRGWDSLLSGRARPPSHKARKVRNEDRMFSMSSVTAPAEEEVLAWEAKRQSAAQQTLIDAQAKRGKKRKNE
eukprot:TRINITY_DN427_c0_g1_i4.p3 TRINITY_DN427_c0_g1~~TRINITY_DN427_c0_g1_i4.p3  ORF type:complete len:121 (-),score=8.14 TRINITY_DN427_c0_g1_i4:152-514(-)